MTYSITLSGLEPRFKGSVRAVYVHPDDSKLLIKVPHEGLHDRVKVTPEWKKRFKPLGAGAANMHELRETMRVRPTAMGRLKHIFTVKSMVETDLGWGLVVEAEFGQDGNYAPVLSQIVNQPELYQNALEEFLDWIPSTNAVFYDLNPWNLVLAWRNGKQEIVIVDGIGEKSAIQARTYFPSINKKENQKVIERFQRHLEKIKGQTF